MEDTVHKLQQQPLQSKLAGVKREEFTFLHSFF